MAAGSNPASRTMEYCWDNEDPNSDKCNICNTYLDAIGMCPKCDNYEFKCEISYEECERRGYCNGDC
jgi:hypothetical protein